MLCSKLLCGADHAGMKPAQGRQALHRFSREALLTIVGCSRSEHGHRRV